MKGRNFVFRLFLFNLILGLLIFNSAVSQELKKDQIQDRMVDPAIDKEGPFSYLAKPSNQLSLITAADTSVQVTFDGAFYAPAGELCFFYGDTLKPVMVRAKTYLNNWIPILSYSWKEEGINYAVEAFNMTIEEPVDSPQICFVKVKIKNENDKESKVNFASAFRFSGFDHRYEKMKNMPFSNTSKYEMTDKYLLRDNEMVYVYPAELTKEKVPGIKYEKPYAGNEEFITARSENALTKLNKSLAPGEEVSLIYKLPIFPVKTDDKAILDKIASADYSEYRDRTVKYWEKMLSQKSELILPEQKVVDAHKASFVYEIEAIKMKDGKQHQSVNKIHYNRYWLRDAAYINHSYDVWGLKDIVRKNLECYTLYQGEDGLFMSHKKQLDGFGQALYALGINAIYTNDKDYANQIYPHFPKALAWFKKARAEDPFKLMPFTDVKDNEFIQAHYTGHNFWALLGLRTGIRIAEMTGHKEDAAEFKKEYDDLKTSLFKKLDEVCGKDGYIPPGLDAKGGQDWGNLIGVYPAEVIDTNDPRLTTTLKKMHDEKYMEGIMTYMDGLHQYLTVKATQNHVFRGDQEQTLKDFYSIMVHMGAANEMFEWKAKPWGERDVYNNFTPHGWGAAMFNLLLRNMLIREYGGEGGLNGRDIHLFSVLSPEWVKPGKEIAMKNAPTECGPVSFSMKVDNDGADIAIAPSFFKQPDKIIIHIPYFVMNVKCEANPSLLEQTKDAITFTNDVTKIRLTWKMKKCETMNFEKFRDDYIKEYAVKYDEYIKAGKKPVLIEAPKMQTADERKAEYNGIYAPGRTGIAVGKPVKASGKWEGDHTPELAFDGNSIDAQKSSWWSEPVTPQWLEVDLGKIEKVNELQVYPYWDGNRYYQYYVEVSPDEKTWTKVADMSANTLPAKQSGDNFKFAPVDARYVKITMTYNSAYMSVHLVELKVFAEEEKK